ncbi:8701_t:CDS:2 [Diversispora eburnea]|uniref:8701_t:CDS:1 n=1 Tax=Diversispora eburnea TaxID=1213867 RepID=A0A9N9C9L0_9GLOM|nr:8701_t:CDS:2 [Diversispora eburnea]
MNSKSQEIKKIVAKINLDKIAEYLKEHSTSKTLKQIISHNKKAINSSNDEEIFKLAVKIAYNLDTIVNTKNRSLAALAFTHEIVLGKVDIPLLDLDPNKKDKDGRKIYHQDIGQKVADLLGVGDLVALPVGGDKNRQLEKVEEFLNGVFLSLNETVIQKPRNRKMLILGKDLAKKQVENIGNQKSSIVEASISGKQKTFNDYQRDLDDLVLGKVSSIYLVQGYKHRFFSRVLQDYGVIAFISQKGGVGKSTFARLLATEVTKKKIKTLLADCDHQQKTNAPARTSQGTLEVAKKADLIIQPVGASRDDLLPALREFNALKAQGINKNKLLFILNHLSTPTEILATQEYLTESGYSFAPYYLYEKASYRQAQSEGKSISEVNFASLRQQSQKLVDYLLKKEISENIKAPETAPSDKRITGRTKQLNFKVREEFYWKLKNIAVEEKCLMVEILEKSLESYEREKKVKSGKELEKVVKVIEPKPKKPQLTPYYPLNFACDNCGDEYEQDTAYSYAPSMREINDFHTYCSDCATPKSKQQIDKEYYQKNKEKKKQQQQERYQQDKEKLKSQRRDKYQQDKETEKAKRKQRYQQQKEQSQLSTKQYYRAESIKILMSLKEYTELNQQKHKLYADFC